MSSGLSLPQSERYFSIGFGLKPEAYFILVWTLEGKRSQWFTSPQNAAAYAVTLEGKNVFAGVGVSPEAYPPVKSESGIYTDRRCLNENVAGIGWLWCDIDFAASGHKQQNLPPNVAAATSILDAFPTPSLVVNSGGGLHAYWRFEEYWAFSTVDERAEASTLSRRLNLGIKNIASGKGWHADSVPDLARVLRVPGTFNVKPEYSEPRAVTIVSDRSKEYNPSDFDFLPQVVETNPKQISLSGIPGSGVPDKLLALIENDPETKIEWNAGTPRKSGADITPSGRDMRLGYRCAHAGFSDNEIRDSMLAMRRRHGSKSKA